MKTMLGPLPPGRLFKSQTGRWYEAAEVTAYAAEQVTAERERCARIVREARDVHGLCCSDGKALAALIDGLGGLTLG